VQRIVVGKTYRFIPPGDGRFWPTVVPYILPFYLRKAARIESVDFIGLEFLRDSLAKGSRIILAPNHPRTTDPMLLSLLSKEVGQLFHYLTNWHAFLENKAQGWLMHRMGCFSICREGADRKALKAASTILSSGKRPLVIFPEGEVSRTNDFLSPFMRGLSFIVKTAVHTLLKQDASRVVVHPIAVRYVLSENIETSLHQFLDDIEARFHWTKSRLILLKRIVKIGKELLAMTETEHLGFVQHGEISIRVERLKEELLRKLEKEWLSGKPRPCITSRVNSLRSVILRKMLEAGKKSDMIQRCRQALKKIELAVKLSNYPYHYLRDNPTVEKLTETVECMEQDFLHRFRVHGRWKAILQVGEQIEIRPDVFSTRQLTESLHDRVQMMLDALRTPVPSWA